MSIIGIDLGGTKLASAILSDDGKINVRNVYPLEGRQGGEVGALIVDSVQVLFASARAEGESVRAVGVSVPGIYYAESGNVWAPNIPGWDDYPLLDELRAACDDSLPIRIASDRACCILGETWLGSAQGCRDAIFLAVGTGIGAGILSGGRVLRGHRDIAGAIGWLALDRPFRPEYENVGCFEYHASGNGIAKVAREMLTANPLYRGRLRDTNPALITAHDVFEAQAAGDTLAVRVVEQAIAFWGMAAANLVSLFDPEMIVFGGGVFGPATRFIPQIRAEAARWAQPISMSRVKMEASRLGSDAALCGAARLGIGNALPVS